MGAGAHHRQVPIAELGSSLDDSATDEVGVGVGEVGGDGEQMADGDRLLLEDLSRHLVATLAEGAQFLGCGIEGRGGQLVVGVTREPVRQQVVADARERREALDIADEAAVALRHRLAIGEQTFHRDVHVAELAGHPRRTA